MKYLKKSAEVLIAKAGGQNKKNLSRYDSVDHTAMLTMITHYSDGSGEDVSGIFVTREHLEQIRKAIDDYLSKADNNDANEPNNSKQTNETGDKDATQFKLDPSRVMSMKIGAEKWEARTRFFNGINNELADLIATADSEESARKELDKKFSDFAGPMTNFIKFMSQAS